MTTGWLAADLAAAALVDGRASSAEAALFWVLAPVMVIAALGLLFARKAVHAALGVILVMVSLAVMYIAQDAPFLGAVQIVVYTGAVMMLFVFVLMLVGVDSSDSLVETIRGQRWIGVLLGLGLGTVLVTTVVRTAVPDAAGLSEYAPTNPADVAGIVFGDFVLTFEVVGVLLVVAALGALVLTHRRRITPRVGQRERADARVLAGARLTPLAAPGVYAQHNAMDVPALDPTGRPIEESVSRVLRARGQEADAEGYRRRIESFARATHDRGEITGSGSLVPDDVVDPSAAELEAADTTGGDRP